MVGVDPTTLRGEGDDEDDQGSGSPPLAADTLVADHGGWRDPWVES